MEQRHSLSVSIPSKIRIVTIAARKGPNAAKMIRIVIYLSGAKVTAGIMNAQVQPNVKTKNTPSDFQLPFGSVIKYWLLSFPLFMIVSPLFTHNK